GSSAAASTTSKNMNTWNCTGASAKSASSCARRTWHGYASPHTRQVQAGRSGRCKSMRRGGGRVGRGALDVHSWQIQKRPQSTLDRVHRVPGDESVVGPSRARVDPQYQRNVYHLPVLGIAGTERDQQPPGGPRVGPPGGHNQTPPLHARTGVVVAGHDQHPKLPRADHVIADLTPPQHRPASRNDRSFDAAVISSSPPTGFASRYRAYPSVSRRRVARSSSLTSIRTRNASATSADALGCRRTYSATSSGRLKLIFTVIPRSYRTLHVGSPCSPQLIRCGGGMSADHSPVTHALRPAPAGDGCFCWWAAGPPAATSAAHRYVTVLPGSGVCLARSGVSGSGCAGRLCRSWARRWSSASSSTTLRAPASRTRSNRLTSVRMVGLSVCRTSRPMISSS